MSVLLWNYFELIVLVIYGNDKHVADDITPFIQTRCETIFGWREELFHPLTSVSSSRPDGYYTKVDISMLSDYGDVYILLSETNERNGPNPCYEFGNVVCCIWFLLNLPIFCIIFNPSYRRSVQNNIRDSPKNQYNRSPRICRWKNVCLQYERSTVQFMDSDFCFWRSVRISIKFTF